MERLRVTSKKGLVLRSSVVKSSKVVATLPPDSVVVRVAQAEKRSFVVSFSGEHSGWAPSSLLKKAPEQGRALRKLRQAVAADRAAVRPAALVQCCLECDPDDAAAAAAVYEALLDLASGPDDATGTWATYCLFGMASSPSCYAVRTRGAAEEGDAPAGAVVLLGWGGCHLSELDRVDDLYARELPGWQTLATTTSALPAPEGDDRLGAHAAALREAQFRVVIDACEAAPRVVVHCFSNNGAGALAELLTRAPHLAGKISRVAFDSAATLAIGANMVDVVLGSVLGDLRRLAAPGALVAKVKAPALARSVKSAFADAGPTPMDAALKNLVEATLPKDVPVCFLYSKTDKLIVQGRVEEFADRIAAHRPDGDAGLTRVVFDGSGHVRHLDTFPEEYRAAVAGLVAGLPAKPLAVVG